VTAYALREGSGGEGCFRGGDGIRRAYEFLEGATVTINSERRVKRPYGLRGGEAGESGINRLIQGGEQRVVGGKATVQVKAGDRLIIETPGGGGWGKAEAPEQSF
jgi:N-methylhydantoinase B/oxoprolinase/acetone carboxylase alpha subunit